MGKQEIWVEERLACMHMYVHALSAETIKSIYHSSILIIMKCEDLLIFSALYQCDAVTFGLWSVGRTKKQFELKKICQTKG